ncbi:MAG: Omp28-related outer membrane protein [Flavobacteriales bacterium]|jgi:hypothetical protein|nr:Omp28-related outer membrane protein [Flavobacteriales bacterium]NCG29423.1 Omp28-related outer membrane protein [Bacteroidota bacterium]MBT3963126.1 Omp28-related outer membrane protein [Flavobacteriales bacterium]MBT4705229.1 Omp28-related outer membrane protein [Flavobacteriales bacterium]MBT4931326.1 Omp28-related outer membrane protein [Flavobacteriales bacterium]
MKRILLSGLAAITAAAGLNAQVILSEDFESGVPGSWTQVTLATDGGWLAGDATSLSSASFPIPEHGNFIATNDDGCNCDKSADSIFTESFDLTGLSAPRLVYDVFYGEFTYQAATESFDIYASDDGGATWSMLQDLTGDGNGWRENEIVDLSAYAGSANVQLAFIYNDGAGWLYGAAVDNVVVEEPSPFDIKLSAIAVPRYVTSTGTQLAGSVLNNGANSISSYTVSWTDGTTTNTETITTSLAPGASEIFIHSDLLALNAGDEVDVTVYVETANDGNLSNDTLAAMSSGVSFIPVKAVVGEEATGTWCGWCPRGFVYMEYMEDTYGEDWIGVAVHNGDPMTNSDYDTWMGGQVPGYPSGLISRDGNAYDPSDFETPFATYINQFGLAEIEVEATMDMDNVVTVDITATFAASTSDDLRLSAIVIEDHVTGTTADYNQANYYAGGGSGAMGGWENLAASVPAADMSYDDVGRELLGGIDGDAGSVPSSVTADDVVEYSYTFTMDGDWDHNNVRIAALLLDNSTGAIWNAAEDDFIDYEYEDAGETYSVVDGDTFELWDGNWVPLGNAGVSIADVNIFPNPAKDVVSITGMNGLKNITIYDALGRTVLNQALYSNTLDVSGLNAGYYNIVIENDMTRTTKSLTVVK